MNPVRWLSRLYHTLAPLRWEQWLYRFWLPVKRMFWSPPTARRVHLDAAGRFPKLPPIFPSVPGPYDPEKRTFVFQNRKHSFGYYTNHNYRRLGKLWTYQLNYFDWLEDEDIFYVMRMHSIEDFVITNHRRGLATYPTSRRIPAWVLFLSVHRSRDGAIYRQLYGDARRVAALPERHLLGNHLWENAFGIFAAALLFHDKPLFTVARRLIFEIIEEQILGDGAHYERAPYYHALLLKRLFLGYYLFVGANRFQDPELDELMRDTISRMLGWLDAIAFSDDSLPTVSDVPPETVPGLIDFHKAARRFGIDIPDCYPDESGYRMGVAGIMEFFVNIGTIGPSYQPGHAHADTLSYALSIRGFPLIIDPGTGTYARGKVRSRERSTVMHNTVNIQGRNSSEVWSAFRVGRRAQILDLVERPRFLEATHDGYRRQFGILHRRRWEWRENYLQVTDWLDGCENAEGEMRLHFNHTVVVSECETQNLYRCDTAFIRILGAERISLQTFEQPISFGKYETATVMVCSFKQTMTTTIEPDMHAD